MIKNQLRNQIKYVIDNSQFYKNKFNHLTADELYNNFNRIEFTTKLELLKDQEIYPPFGRNLTVNPTKIKRIHKTSGTTNRPLLIALTENDIKNTVKIGSKCFKSAGLKKSDLVIHCLNYNMWAGGYTDHQSLEETGAGVIPFGVGNSFNLIETILLLRPTAIHCTPSYLKKLELIIRNEFHLEPTDLKISLGLFGAEAGLQNSLFRQNIENVWGMKAMNANYGLSDVLSMFGSECKFQKGLHFFGSEVLFPELINPKTKEVLPIIKGSVGELVLTNLFKEAQPLLRYRTNDIIKVLSTEKCECGSNEFVFEIIGRSDDMIVIKGVNLYLGSIEEILSDHFDALTGIFQVHVNKTNPIDTIKIFVEKKISVELDERFSKNLQLEFSHKLNISPDVIIFAEGELPRTEGKSKKLFRII